MMNFFQTITNLPLVRNIRERWLALTEPIRTPYQKWTAPLRASWAAYTLQHPRSGFVLGWTGTFAKWMTQFLIFLVFGTWIGLFGRLPSTEKLRNLETANATFVYSADSVLLGKYFIENRNAIALDDISPYVVKALIAVEDKRYLEHRGIDLTSWARVAYGVVTRSPNKGGGSTLTQQLAKNLYPRRNYHIPGVSLFINKIRENFISIRLEKVYSKDELLSLYLNTVPFGGDIFGISVASKRYFNKKAKELTVDQAALLIGTLKASTYYNPVRNPDNAIKRRNVVLEQMVKNGDLTQEDFKKYSAKPVGTSKYYSESTNDGVATYFREHLRLELDKTLQNYKREDGKPYNLYTDGLRIYTSIHSKMQEYAEAAVQKQMQVVQKSFIASWKNVKKAKPWGDDKWIEEAIKRCDRYNALKDAGLSHEDIRKNFDEPVKMTIFSWENGGMDKDTTLSPVDSVRYYFQLLNCGLMVMDHRNSYVRAWVGGINFKYFKYDHIKSTRQVGSTFKPIVYAAALRTGVKPCDYFPNKLYRIADWEPHNANERYGGHYSMVGGLENSVNTITAQMIDKAGVQNTIDLAQKMGVSSKMPKEAGIALGAADISLFDMMQVYSTFANKGVKQDPVYVLKILDRDGNVIYDKDAGTKPIPTAADSILTVEESEIMTRMMKAVVDNGTGDRLKKQYIADADFAGKTGTTQNQSDGWFMCYNPVLVVGSWVGGVIPAVQFRSLGAGQGASTALPIIGDFWVRISKDKKLSKILYTKFEEKEPEKLDSIFACMYYNEEDEFFGIDTLHRDTSSGNMFSRLKENMTDLFGKKNDDDSKSDDKDKGTSKEGNKSGKDDDDTPNKGNDNDKDSEVKDKKSGKKFFEKLLGKKDKKEDGQD